MYLKIILVAALALSCLSCSKKEEIEYKGQINKVDPYKLYEEGFDAFNRSDYFFAEKKF